MGIWTVSPRLLAVASVAFVAGVTAPAVASAEVGGPGTPTVQAVAADATWLAYAPPPAQPGIVCMVDSGVDRNPDTEAAVIGGQAIAPETGTEDEIARLEPPVEPGDHPDGHGTIMAMLMAAPRNGWGMVGLAPTSVRVYNMKALPAGQVTFPFSYYAAAIEDCRQLRASDYPGMSVINLSLGGASQPVLVETELLADYVSAAHEGGLSVVAAAGDEQGPVLYPAAYGPVLAVGAGDAGAAPGTVCSFAARGEALDLIAPGCDGLSGGLEEVFQDDGEPAVGAGSSQASAFVSATLASMRAYNPALSWSAAEACLISTAEWGAINVAVAFDACGLGGIVAEGRAAERAAVGSPLQASPRAATSPPAADVPVGVGATRLAPATRRDARCTHSKRRRRDMPRAATGTRGRRLRTVIAVRTGHLRRVMRRQQMCAGSATRGR
jgi:hypothetical protein